MIRIVIGQLKKPASGVDTSAQVFTSSNANNTLSPIDSYIGPLQNGASRSVHILYDKRYMITD